MSTPINYLNLDGVTNLKNEFDNRYVTADSVNTIVNNAPFVPTIYLPPYYSFESYIISIKS